MAAANLSTVGFFADAGDKLKLWVLCFLKG
ncbi:hypothetical protein ZEAMMB73_Zm00001d041331 [Zea mays]|uniref:Uncharacterized protein n=1 Tax=Zea mays TaxID=4577 RepID=A0A1D6MVJ0_MAIZE|nr:hypothetical protein ZEAMMB73_Zm00001d041331 [Zea mays]